jgi:hypothetical protein
MSERIYCQHGRRINSCDSCDVIEAEAEIENIKRQRDQLLVALNETHAALCLMDINAEPGKQYIGSKQWEMNRAAIAAAQQPEGA